MWGRKLKVAAVAVVVMVLTVLGCVVHERWQQAFLEGNRLQTADAVTVTMAPAQARAWADAHPGRGWVWLTGADGERYLYGDASSWRHFPVGQGRVFRDGENRVALVGAEIPTRRVQDHQEVAGLTPTVVAVGQLGSGMDSLLARDVVVRDSSMFTDGHPARLVVDGPAAKDFIATHPGLEAAPAVVGASARTNADQVTPILLGLSALCSVLGSVLVGVLAAREALRRRRVLHLLGQHWRRCLVQETCVLVGMLVVVWALGVGAMMAAGIGVDPAELTAVAAGAVAVAAAGLVLTASHDMRGQV